MGVAVIVLVNVAVLTGIFVNVGVGLAELDGVFVAVFTCVGVAVPE